MLNRLWYSINITFICNGNEKHLCDLLNCSMCFSNGLELNLSGSKISPESHWCCMDFPCLLTCYLPVCHLKPSAFSSICDEWGSNCYVAVFRSLSFLSQLFPFQRSLGFSPSVKGKRCTCACVCELTRECTSLSKCLALKKKENTSYASVFMIIFISRYLQMLGKLVWRHFCCRFNLSGISYDRKMSVRNPPPPLPVVPGPG